MKLMLEKARLSFPVLWTPQEYQKGDGKPRYSAVLLIPKGSPQLKKITASIMNAGVELWGQKFRDKAFRQGVRMDCYKDGDTVHAKKGWDGYEGHMVISSHRPAKQGELKVLDWDKSPLRETDGRPYAGCYVNASIEFWADKRFGEAINCSLIALQFAGNGPAFAGGSQHSDDDFNELDPPEGLEERPSAEETTADDWDEPSEELEDDLLS